MNDATLNDCVTALLADAGIRSASVSLSPCPTGGNNRVYRAEVDGRSYAVKQYFVHPADCRNRLGAEFVFLTYAKRIGLHCVPQPVAQDAQDNIAIYEFIDGRKLEAGELTEQHVDQALRFLRALNVPANRILASGLPAASEACFSIAEQLSLVQQRIDRLGHITPEAEVDKEAAMFVGCLRSAWDTMRERVLEKARVQGLVREQPLAPDNRCVSPSDFGFHNAVVRPSGDIVFIDFEYAGWDDPAKTVSDFFSHPAMPVPMNHLPVFLTAVASFGSDPKMLAERTRLLFPVFQIKWCCIILNDFLPDLLERHKFANPEPRAAARKTRQLDKARRLLQTIQA